MRKILLVLTIAATGAFCKGHKESTSSNDVQKVREVKNFDAIEVSGAIDLTVLQGTEEGVTVNSTSDEMVARTKTEVENGVLKIYFDDKGANWDGQSEKISVSVKYVDVKRIEASGASNVVAENAIKESDLKLDLSGASKFVGEVTAKDLKILASGACNYKLDGKAETMNIDASGASDIKAYDLQTNYCSIDASGASDIKVRVEKQLDVDASGGSSVLYKGMGVVKKEDMSGGASIKRVEE
jgi:hypothetical protein